MLESFVSALFVATKGASNEERLRRNGTTPSTYTHDATASDATQPSQLVLRFTPLAIVTVYEQDPYSSLR